MTPSQRDWQDWRDLLILVVVWGSSFALTKIAVEDLAPGWVVAYRVTLGAVFLMLLMSYKGKTLPKDWASWSWFLWLGLVGNVMPFLLISWATSIIPSSLAGILIAAVPLITIAIAPLIVKDEPLTWPKAIVFIVGFVGVILMIGPSALFTIGTNNQDLLAQGAILLAALGYALNGLTARRIHIEDKMIIGTGALISASVLSLPLAIIMTPTGWQTTSLDTISSIIMLGIFPTALASLVLYTLLPRTSASFVGLSNYLVPGFAVLIGVLLLGETLDSYDYIGLTIVLGAVWIAGKKS